ncbi:hypothetical protein HPA02_28270 [Bisbaumannia pacifica]|uniref:Uncharacterized protein n=1 Tax=Bisbaumannia pacifica TaxID=77098 RepID=A0A510XAU3_9GAMM|nr:hypothetical protein [Halomonas pacifica]GEK48544.1 hypothetical protein HPA02_28270 [Halomonas pacifica]
MKTRLLLLALPLVALPLMAQADRASQRALELNQAPTSQYASMPDRVQEPANLHLVSGTSEAMAQAWLRLKRYRPPMHVDANGNPLSLGRQATH